MAINDTKMSRAEALLQYSARERVLICYLERIATGTTNQGAKLDLELVREDARDALREIGWPVIDDIKTRR